MSDQASTPTESAEQHRAAVVAGIRALADLIEGDTNLPVPNGVTAQYSASGSDDHQIAQAREVADLRGQRVRVHADTVQVHSNVASNASGTPYFRVTLDFCGRVETRCTPECDDLSVPGAPTGLARGFHHDDCPVAPLLETIYQNNAGGEQA